MLNVGDEVILMSAVGRFRIVAVDGHRLCIENAAGLRKEVLDSAVRRIEPAAAGDAA